jgi:Winged helix DNA-binding domain
MLVAIVGEGGAMRHVSDDERRARLAVRHALAPAYRVDSPEAATRAMTVLHATDAATVYLSSWARVESLRIADVDGELYERRSLVRQLAMRRTLFVFPRDLLPAVWPSASARVAGIERARMVKDVVKAGLADDGDAWLDRARSEVLNLLVDAPGARSAIEIRQAVPMIDMKVAVSAGEVWSAARVVTHLSATADIVRGTNNGRWAASRPQWTLMRHWLGEIPEWCNPGDGYRELTRRWLRTFGPGTVDDLVWWLGATKTVVRKALTELDAVAVTLDGGGTGWILPDDFEDVPDPGSWVALLPPLDPTVMGWQGRDFYLGPHRELVFDSRGNAGATVWADGRIVGVWGQDAAGVVEMRLLERLSARVRRAADDEAARLTAWFGGVRTGTIYSSPAMRA